MTNVTVVDELERVKAERDAAIARAEAAEAWRKRAEESEPAVILTVSPGDIGWRFPSGVVGVGEHELFLHPKPAPSTVPEEWLEVLRELADDYAIELDVRYSSRHQYPSEQRKYDNEMAVVNRARALLNGDSHD